MIAKVRRRAISWAGVMKKPTTQQVAGGEGKPYLAAGVARGMRRFAYTRYQARCRDAFRKGKIKKPADDKFNVRDFPSPDFRGMTLTYAFP